MYPCPSSSACLVVLQLPHRKHLLLHNPVGKLRHKTMMVMPSLQRAALVWHCLTPCPPQGIIPSHTRTSIPQHGVPAVWERGCGDPRSLHNRIWGFLAGGKTAMVAAATSGVPAPPQGSLLLPGVGRWEQHHPSAYVQPTNKYHLPWEGGVRVSACVCVRGCIYIYIYLFIDIFNIKRGEK